MDSEYTDNNDGNIDDYNMGKTLGQGAYAQVKQATHTDTGNTLAVKIYDKYKLIDTQKKKNLKHEIKVL